MSPSFDLTSYLSRQKFDTAETADAAGVSVARLADWIKRGVFAPLTEAKPGTGRGRQFLLADIYRLSVIGALTDPDGVFSMPASRAVALTDDAFGLDPESWCGNLDMFAECRAALLSGFLPTELISRDRKTPIWLIGSVIDVIVPKPRRRLRGELGVFTENGLPNPLGRARSFVTVEVTPLFAAADRRLFHAKGLAEFFPDLAKAMSVDEDAEA
ncbi:MerR family transcriptional regulator [Falsiroseomonas tokyonensis]|uniref:MerR family transcriptional regulator n=1 Tax=Falsiroseomonas tokyonensis TaxID=430521 RepID=A0ABV7BYG0_9PROT|nr:MerR family transcriptional regulator [Falsiroseomonas tokyonensis]MBU8539491.1 MerR family transcriptional regulator [Falsiroseomonas tokyonensis]